MEGVKPVQTPMATNTSLLTGQGKTLEDATLYRSTVGALQYATLTQSDISFALNNVCQFLKEPTEEHWSAVKLILRYLKETVTHGLLINKNSSNEIHAYNDANWAGCPNDRRSTGDYTIYMGQNLISWSVRKQHTIARSSTESEYRGVGKCNGRGTERKMCGSKIQN
ncbi:uncharacterized mitochondrial protein AtMg00810-like [Macadamia integrifolia]|uniref:uncharacterized mitochondrial protein AtMg00810-like n=1 Tax=Macadamia integrifolia TaxID=60698 RepID=UPI001C4F2BA6|nr:uncharacterized mitochondrial protein AtMg00810-like [Macadamia integrifolia]